VVDTFEKLVRTRDRLLRLERVAFGMDAKAGADEPRVLSDDQREAVRLAIIARYTRPGAVA
jgi:hypothetical protein